MRWIWIDRFLEFESGKSAKAVKNLSTAEDHFRDHFPGYPVMPAALIIEGLAQTGGILVGEANQFREKVVLAKIAKTRFEREMFAGEQLIYQVEILMMRPEAASVLGKVFVDGVQTAEAEIFFAHLDQARSKQMFGDHNFVFSGELKYLLGLAKVASQTGKDSPG
ncbi:MAG: beta-hydroxyacyl-ACP dehydratase [Planctomycetota bacterium]|jgi:3-hydroxyacyl-[acyl-carrier-protein] dehydratase|nr:beta-hydroxyacyl-ACP dehydratase [Gemmataceae bacterium]MCY2970415.1 beta-hydroxyacyl-ACP dehydratase [Planctomycetota bacterium]NBS88774.1 beta-hydroxyacyl-ACP dehydratase [bacterium]NBT61443.1 beta-hydroxyacyl-ACP dehydratase [Planctomycetia bacterium]MBJ7344416.1 beta-hydroxyacyl-ACP dehydratase [Gemmataceae bacterium]